MPSVGCRARDPEAAPGARRDAGQDSRSASRAEKEGFADALGRIDRGARPPRRPELGLFAERSEDIANCAQRATGAVDAARALARRARRPRGERRRRGHRLSRMDPLGRRHASRAGSCNASPLSVADVFSKARSPSRAARGSSRRRRSPSARISRSTSASSGLVEAATGCWESPFDYASQALLYVPQRLPAPNSREHTEAVVAAALPVLRASGGRAFLLFTTLRALDGRTRISRRRIRRRGPRLAAARAGRRLAQRAPDAIPRARQRRSCWAARASGRASMCRARRCPS